MDPLTPLDTLCRIILRAREYEAQTATDYDGGETADNVDDEDEGTLSVLDDASLDRLREAIWTLTGLIRVFPTRDGRRDDEPFALPAGATVSDLADRVHHDLGARATGARVSGPSARFDGQLVGRGHVLRDGDTVEIVMR